VRHGHVVGGIVSVAPVPVNAVALLVREGRTDADSRFGRQRDILARLQSMREVSA